ncbi:MAG: M20/M25/M40 family metallo-hydrolase [Thermomicrobiales bacterium]|nr:M20/M25/M40 family metallo-hydrolase [Thermomicrobiales bacterium]MCO5222616.1 M20/M25/M40 family metallo-hydrolase [Thermomicrobiales bacterium]
MSASAASPSSAHDRSALLSEFDRRDADVVQLTIDLIAAPSPNPPGDETAPAALIVERCRALGLPAPRVIGKEPHRPNVLLTIEGDRPGPHLGFCGHTDTKPAGDALDLWTTDPYVGTIVDERLYGLGSTDMKGALAAMLFAAEWLQRHTDVWAGRVTFMFSADEEYGSRFGAYDLVESGAVDGIDAIILGEPSGIHNDWDAIRTVSRGASCFEVVVTGTQMHSSLSDSLGAVNAVEAMARLMVCFREELTLRYPEHPLCPTGPTINIGVKTEGGVGYGVVPGQARFYSDIRTLPGMDRDIFREDIETALARCSSVLDGATARVVWPDGMSWASATEIPPDHPAVVAARTAAESVLGFDVPIAAFTGGTDAIAFQGRAGIPTLAALGPGLLPLAHGPNEWVSLQSLREAMRIYALTVVEYCQSA